MEGLFARPAPLHPGLLRGTLAVEAYAGELFSVPGTVPDLRRPPAGCRSTPAVPWRRGSAGSRCAPLMARAEGGADACWRAGAGGAHTWDGLAAAEDEIETRSIEAGERGPAPDAPMPEIPQIPLIEGRDLRKHFRVGGDCSDQARSCGRWTASPWPGGGGDGGPGGGVRLGQVHPGAGCWG